MVKIWDVKSGVYQGNLLKIDSGGSVRHIRASNTKLVCDVRSRNGTELVVIDFDDADDRWMPSVTGFFAHDSAACLALQGKGGVRFEERERR